jgi:hypothetical protein
MRDYAKTGGKVGRPAYRTPSSFIAKKILKKFIQIRRKVAEKAAVWGWKEKPKKF